MKKRNLQDLNLLDRFLFAEAMEDKEIMETVVRIILNDDTIVLKETPHAESEKRKIKSSEDMGEKYMHNWEERVYDRAEGKAEGKAEKAVKMGRKYGLTDEQIISELLEVMDEESAKEYLENYKKENEDI